MGKQHLDSLIVALLLAVMPVMLMTDIGHSSGAFIALAVVSLSLCFSREGGIRRTWQDLGDYRLLAAALFVPLLAIVLSMAWYQQLLDSDAERAVRTSFGLLIILFGCLSLKPQWLRQAAWGLTLGTLAAGVCVIWMGWPTLAQPGEVPAYNAVQIGQWIFTRPEDLPEYNTVSYGNMLLMMTVLSTLSIGWQLTRFRKTEVALKLLIALIGVMGLLVTQTRGGWLAIPFFIVIGLVLRMRTFTLRKLFLPVVGICVLLAVIFIVSPITRHRSEDAGRELTECMHNPNAVSSVCIRVQLWHASWLMFKEHPLLGNGSRQAFAESLKKLAEKKVVSSFIMTDVFDEPHNDIMFAMASNGLVGLIGLLLLYFAPAWIFVKRLGANVPQHARVAAAMGLAVCLGFFIFGITELMFRGMRTMGFYAAMIAWLLALSDTQRMQSPTQTSRL